MYCRNGQLLVFLYFVSLRDQHANLNLSVFCVVSLFQDLENMLHARRFLAVTGQFLLGSVSWYNYLCPQFHKPLLDPPSSNANSGPMQIVASFEMDASFMKLILEVLFCEMNQKHNSCMIFFRGTKQSALLYIPSRPHPMYKGQMPIASRAAMKLLSRVSRRTKENIPSNISTNSSPYSSYCVKKY
jgi:hypothetical protein